jgi:hypothetical protein
LPKRRFPPPWSSLERLMRESDQLEMKSECEIGVLDDRFPYEIVVRRSDGPTITALLEEARKLAERTQRLLCITSEGAIFHFAERQAAVDFVFQCKVRDIDINPRKWPGR